MSCCLNIASCKDLATYKIETAKQCDTSLYIFLILACIVFLAIFLLATSRQRHSENVGQQDSETARHIHRHDGQTDKRTDR